MPAFNGLGMSLGNLSRLSQAKTRSICAENPTGAKGQGGMATEGLGAAAARDLGQTWKIAPAVLVKAGETYTMADIQGPGAIQHIWTTPSGTWRFNILRIYWDGQENPSVECPIGDFFAHPWGSVNTYIQLSSLAVCNNPKSGLNCYWEMPFQKSCRMTLTNIAADDMVLFYQIDYTLTEVPEETAYFHAQFRRANPLPYKQDYTILDGVEGWGHYVGASMAWGVNNSQWWGEGEIKFFMDGDHKFPTICGTGTEDYFCGSYGFENGKNPAGYQEWTGPYTGMPQIVRPDGAYISQTRFALYRWHILDPIRFEKNLRVTIQALGWRTGFKQYLPLQDDIASVAYWYQTLPTTPFPALPDKDTLEII